MTGIEVDLETQAKQIAARGRDALVERMRIAYSDAAAAHADLISLDDDRIEAMVQSAADRADGLQWRRALAAVAAEELGVSASEALSHPAVVRAQTLLGAPSYEQSLAELIARPVPPPAPTPAETGAPEATNPAAASPEVAIPRAGVPEPQPPEPQPPLPEPIPEPGPEPEPEPEPVPGPMVASGAETARGDEQEAVSDELESVEADDVVLELLPEPEPIEYETEAYDVESSFAHEPVPPAPVNPFAAQTAHEAAAAQEQELAQGEAYAQDTAEHASGGVVAAMATVGAEPGEEEAPVAHDQAEDELTIVAIHLGGVANLPTKRDGLNVRLSADGLDIMQGPRDIIGRLVWDEIEALEVPHLRARRRAKQLRARLVVRTPHGDASFEVPDTSAEELRERVEPLMRLYGRH